MSGKNKVNPDHYKVAGRLSQDDLARARRIQSEPLFGVTRRRKHTALPPWMLNDQSGHSSVAHTGAATVAASERDDAGVGVPGSRRQATGDTTQARLSKRAKPTKSTRSTKATQPSKTTKTAKTTKTTKAKSTKATRSTKAGTTGTRNSAQRRGTPTRRTSTAKKSIRAAARKAPRSVAKKTTRRVSTPVARKASKKAKKRTR